MLCPLTSSSSRWCKLGMRSAGRGHLLWTHSHCAAKQLLVLHASNQALTANHAIASDVKT